MTPTAPVPTPAAPMAAAGPYDSLLVISFGGPEGMDDVMPFLENVLRGRNVPRERMVEVAHHYEAFGGVSPINRQNRELIAALDVELKAHGIDLPIYFGNRNWHPLLPDAMRQMRDDGRRNALAFFTSAFSSYSGCRQYRENIANAQAEVGDDGAPQFALLRKFYNHPGFIAANVDHVRRSLDQIPADRRAAAHVAFTAHSIPLAMAKGSMYEAQLLDACATIAKQIGIANWQLVYQSRSGPPTQPWLAPDILEHLRQLKDGGVSDVLVLPLGFISDHMEVLYDLDDEAKTLCRELGLNMVRVPTVGTHPAFVSAIREMIVERMAGAADRPALGGRGPSHDVCPANCCMVIRDPAGGGRPVSAATSNR